MASDEGGAMMGEDAVERHLANADKMQKKVRLMKGRNNYVQKVFEGEIPATEKVINDFGCTHAGVSGRLFFTQNYVLFCNAELRNPSKLVKSMVPFYTITGTTKEASYLLPNAICITAADGVEHKFTAFASLVRNKAYVTLEHLLQHQPLYAKVKQQPVAEAQPAQEAPVAPKRAKQQTDDDELEYLTGRWTEFSHRWEEEEAETSRRASASEYVKPDTALVRDAIRTVYEINHIGQKVVGKMEEQATMLDNTEDSLAETSANLRNADTRLKSVTSVTGAVKGALTPDVKPEKHERVRAGLDGAKYYDVPILVKHSLGALQHALLRFGPDRFRCVDPIQDTSFMGSVMRTGFWKKLSSGDSMKNAPAGEMPLIRDYDYDYDSVGAVVVRCRPQHIDIRFHDGTERFRCMTSYVQVVANEISLRCGANRVSVIFEPHARRFAFNSEELRHSIKMKPPRIAGLENDNTFVMGGFEKASESIMTNVPAPIKKALDEQDDGVEELEELMRQVNTNADFIGREAQRQVEQLRDVNDKAGKAATLASRSTQQARKF